MTHPNERAVQFRGPLYGNDAVDGSAGLAHEIYAFLAKPIPQVIGHRKRVLDVSLQLKGGGWVKVRVGRAGAALVKRGHNKDFFQGREMVAHGAEFGSTRAAGQEQQDRITRTGAAQHQAQALVPGPHRAKLCNASGQRLAVRAHQRGGRCRPGNHGSQR